MFEKLSFLEEQFEELAKKISDPEVIADQNTWRKLCKEHSDLTPIVEKYREYKKNMETIEDAKVLMDDPEQTRSLRSFWLRSPRRQRRILRKLRRSLKYFSSPRTPMTTRTLWLKSEAAQAVTKRHCSQETCLECTPCMPTAKDGKPRCSA